MLRKHSPVNELQVLSDKELLAEMLAGEDNRYAGELFKRYAHLVFNSCAKYIKNKDDCKDMTMRIFEKMLIKPPVKDMLSFRSWLFTVAKHESLTYLRNRSRTTEQEEKWKDFEKSPEIFMENDSVWSLNNRDLTEIDVHQAIGKLKKEQKTCVELFFLQDKSYKEIEVKTGFSLNQIKSYLQNGKRKLRILIESNKDLT